MIPSSGLWTDGNEINQPPNTWRNMINGVFKRESNTVNNEYGTELFCNNLPSNTTIIGAECSDDEIIVTLYHATGSSQEIGIISASGFYRTVYQYDFNFDIDHAVKIKVIKNSDGQRIIIFNDSFNDLRFVNIDKRITLNDEVLKVLAPNFNRLVISNLQLSSLISEGGSLLSGAYYPIFSLIDEQDKQTNWVNHSHTINISSGFGSGSIGVPGNTRTSKEIFLTLTGIDTSYKTIVVGFISVINGVVEVIESRREEITSTSMNFKISNNEGISLTLSEVISPKLNFRNVRDIEILDNKLYLAGLKDDNTFNYQRYANNIVINYTRQTISNLRSEVADNETVREGFTHGEVYAFYIVFELKDGSWSRAFHIPGRPPVAADTNTNTYASRVNNASANYELTNTAGNSGFSNMGYWENRNEVYPNTDEYDSTSIGGSDLRGEPVRHHMFPTLKYIRDTFFGGDAFFGKTSHNLLGINVENVDIPEYIARKVKSWRICYAKKDVSNSIVLGQSGLILSGITADPSTQREGVYLPALGNGRYGQFSATDERIAPSYKAARFHAFDLLVNKPEISPKFITNEYRMELDVNGAPANWQELELPAKVSEDAENRRIFLPFTTTDAALTVSTTPADEEIIGINKSRYIPANVISGNVDNRYGEECLHLEGDFEPLDGYIVDPPGTPEDFASSNFTDRSYKSTLKQVLENIHEKFYDQEIIPLPLSANVPDAEVVNGTLNGIYGGNSRSYYYSHIVTGPQDGNNYPVGSDSTAAGKGSIAIRNYIVESIGAINFRYQEEGNIQTYYYPEQMFVEGTIMFRYNPELGFQILYNTDHSSVNEYTGILPFNPFDDDLFSFPNRIYESSEFNIEDLTPTFEFLTILGTELYEEIEKNYGTIVGINAFNNRLVIRTDKTILITVPRQRLATSDELVTLAENNIFAQSPVPVIPPDRNLVKSYSRFNSIVTDFGIVIINKDIGRIFLYADKLVEISKIGMQDFFRYNLQLYNNFRVDTFNTFTVTDVDEDTLVTINLDDVNYLYDYNVGDYVYLDNKQGVIRRIEIFENNLLLFTDVEFTGTDSTFRIYIFQDNPHQESINVVFDREYERLIFTKNDGNSTNRSKYKGLYINDAAFNQTLKNEDIVLDNGSLREWDGASLVNPTTLEDTSFTVSYSLDDGVWVSFHDYKPVSFISKDFTFCSYINDQLWKHNSKDNHNIYGVEVDFVMKLIFNENRELIKKFTQLSWFVEFFDKNGNRMEDSDFSEINPLTQNGNAGIINLILDDTVRHVMGKSYYNKLLDENDNLSSLNGFYLEITIKYNNEDFDSDPSISDQYLLYLNQVDSEYKLVQRNE